LASGGGQQGPILAAAGARVTVLDNSSRQLAQDRFVAEGDRLDITTVEDDMRDLSLFPDQSFGLIVNPVSNLFVPDVRPVWREAFRVLRNGGVLLAGFNNPVLYIFDADKAEQGIFEVKYSLPYSDVIILSDQERKRYLDEGAPFEFSQTLEDQIGGQIDAGYLISGFYEDHDPDHPLSEIMPLYIATRAVKL
jgi:SAM-dependent methyltransferase